MKKILTTPLSPKKNTPKDLYESLLKEIKLLDQYIATSSTTPKNLSTRIVTNSKVVKNGDTFIALCSQHANYHRYIKEAIDAGAALIICSNKAYLRDHQHTPWICVKDTQYTHSCLQAYLHNHPQKKLKLLAITGTNGKTTTAWMSYDILRLSGIKCAYIGTLGLYYADGSRKDLSHTTPPPQQLFALLKELTEKNYTCVVMEVSSHSLAQKRLGPIQLEAACLTNLGRDHLDYHMSLDEYWQTKLSIFAQHLPCGAPAIVHHDLANIYKEKNLSSHKITSYKAENKEKLLAKAIDTSIDMLAWVEKAKLASNIFIHKDCGIQMGQVPYIGKFNIDNFLAACLLSKVITKKVFPTQAWKNLIPPPGRMQQVLLSDKTKPTPKVIIDYAHTPCAMENILCEIKSQLSPDNKIKVIFGAGGQRDRGKRPLMFKTAQKYAHTTIITSDNPRQEAQEQITTDILNGYDGNSSYELIVDRKQAILTTIKNSSPKEWILILGKGHENYQIIGTQKLDFCDYNIAKQALCLY
jgi:UDP-N-acetylmuramoyl-L-alanyl-D-glutamate--2,6-diaminopimelate ligase